VEVLVTIEALSPGVYAVTVDGRRHLVHYAGDRARHFVHVDGETYLFESDPAAAGPGPAAVARHHDLRAPMPGLVTQVFVEEGQRVAAGDPLFGLEAMKMEHVVRAAAAGRVTSVAVAPGTQVEGGAIVVDVEDLPEAR
jgi:biotin carboxyl carrier protein